MTNSNKICKLNALGKHMINVIPACFNEDWPVVVRYSVGCRLSDGWGNHFTHTHTDKGSHNDCSQLLGELKPIDRAAVRRPPAQTFLIALWHLHLGVLLCPREQFMNNERAYFLLLFYMLLGTSMSWHKHVLGVVQQIAICTWTGAGDNWGRNKRVAGMDRERRGGVCGAAG